MAFLKVLIFCGIVAVAQVSADVWAGPGFAYAGAWGGNGVLDTEDDDFPDMDMDFPEIKMPEIKLPKMPEIKMPMMPEIKMPKMPKIKIPKMPKIEPINKHDFETYVPGKNEKFTGYSSSSFTHHSDINGVKRSEGASDTILNDNGKVDKESVRYQGGDKRKNKHAEEEDDFFKPLKMKPLKFKPMKPINIEKIRNYVPGKNEKYTAYSTSSVSHSSNINGKKAFAVASQTTLNDNGKVDDETIMASGGDADRAKESSKDSNDDEATVADE